MPEQPSLFGVAEEAAGPVRVPADAAARRAAVDTRRSVLVQAPAGAGKTNLLTERFLALLAEVDEPEEILAITFTRAATAEMRSRVLHALHAAEAGGAAHRALEHARQRGWRLLEEPHRLDIQTIDSLCLRLAHAQPLLARLGGRLQPAEDASALYAAAARRTTARLGADDPALDEALGTLLLRRDNNLGEVERLLAAMLRERGAWLGLLPLAVDDAVEWAAVRRVLEAPFAAAHTQVLGKLRDAFALLPDQLRELLALARYAYANLPEHGSLKPLDACPEDVPGWECLASLLLTTQGEWRRSWDKRIGIPGKGSGTGAAERAQWASRMKDCARQLAVHDTNERLLRLFCTLRSLPPWQYTDAQWATLVAAFRVLRHAAAELRLVFAESGQVDFTEIAQSAEAVLRQEGSLRGLLESERKRHLLIDEFQDTSRTQYRLVAELLREWTEGDGRTVFLVGDPLQSIYLFRQAEVALFHETRRQGLPCGDERRHPCEPLTLTHNFRSHRALVDALNMRLGPVFAEADEDEFVAADAWPSPQADPSFVVHPQFSDSDEEEGDADTQAAREREAEQVVRVLAEELPHAQRAAQAGELEYRIAVLVRSRAHLAAILPAMRRAGIPYRAVDLEPLADQPEIADMLALVRALLHPADRVAWLSVFRAPWCGLLLQDLHTLAGGDDAELLTRPVPELLRERAALLSADGRPRAEHAQRVMESARAARYTGTNAGSLSAWVERTWMELGGALCLDETARANVESFLRLLDEIPPAATEVLRPDFSLRLARLFAAPDARTSERFGVQVMSMHKAKGLGFEVVLLPCLERTAKAGGTEMLAMLERPRRNGEPGDELLLAPVSDSSGERDAVYTWVAAQKRQREQDEMRRLFYVACTRARRRLHLFATVCTKGGELVRPAKGSLAGAAWAGLQQDFAEQLAAQAPAGETQLAAQAEQVARPSAYTLERLPAGWQPRSFAADVAWRSMRETAPAALYERRQTGSGVRRARGTAMHAVLERLAGAGAERTVLERVARRSLGAAGIASSAAMAQQIVQYALDAGASEAGRWALAPHAESATEAAWQHLDAGGVLRTVRVDRSFVAGAEPGAPGHDHLWVLDYKTGAEPGDFADDTALANWLEEQKQFYRGQLETYGAILREARGDGMPLRYALFFAELRRLAWWM